MRKHLQMCALGLVCGMILTACNDDTHIEPPSAVTPAGVGFEAFVQNLAEINTCDKSEPQDTNNIDFTYASDQDTAQPRDVSAVATGCSI